MVRYEEVGFLIILYFSRLSSLLSNRQLRHLIYIYVGTNKFYRKREKYRLSPNCGITCLMLYVLSVNCQALVEPVLTWDAFQRSLCTKLPCWVCSIYQIPCVRCKHEQYLPMQSRMESLKSRIPLMGVLHVVVVGNTCIFCFKQHQRPRSCKC